MLETEFIRNLHCNYERVHLPERPDDQRYQYCILTRGGIRGLLPCSLRYINGQAYLYYDITSRQNVAQLYAKQVIDREWIKDFFWSYRQVRRELGRFLLDEENILVYPEQIFQDLSSHNFIFLYLPYYGEENGNENGMMKFLEFVLGHMDYEDEKLVECMYSMYEQYEKNGSVYLQEKIFEDAAQLDANGEAACALEEESRMEEEGSEEAGKIVSLPIVPEELFKQEKKGLLGRLSGRRKKQEEQKASYRESMLAAMEGRAVAEKNPYEEEEYGKTVYVEQTEKGTVLHKLYTPDGRVAIQLEKESLTIGKQKGEVDLVLEDESVSRLHARIYLENQMVYLEDLNSTNGTFKNGLRLQPYEKRRLEEDDEIRFGKILFVYR
ncbi:MAG: FHA domain-containing protein [Muribaculum sp.]|nr:FHA domain-containing protein [Muribaculum sp.]